MNRFSAISALLLAGWYVSAVEAAAQPRAECTHPVDRVKLIDGRNYDGLIESEDNVWIHLAQLQRRNGRQTHMVVRAIDLAKVQSIVRLDPVQRKILKKVYDKFRNRARIEAGRKEAVRLEVVLKNGVHFHRYRGNWFTLESSVNEETTRWLAVRIEQVFTAYRQILPPRAKPRSRLQIVVLGSMAQYQAYLERLGLTLKNPACYIKDDNLIVAGSDLIPFAAELAKIKARHDLLRKRLETKKKETDAQLAQERKEAREAGQPLTAINRKFVLIKNTIKREVEDLHDQMDLAERVNGRKFNLVTSRMFPRLYHEAFHAYLENYVYPHDRFDVPRWLNEGLAVMFEGGLLEESTLRVDTPNREVLKRLKADLKGKRPLSIEELLNSNQNAFISYNHSDAATSDRHYVYSWGLAYCLTFRMQRLGSTALDNYVEKPANGATPVKRFERFVGMSAAHFERHWRDYILKQVK